MHLYLYAPPRKIYKRLVATAVSREKWVGYKVRTETFVSLYTLSLYALYHLNLIICVYVTDSKNNIHTHTHTCMDTHIHICTDIHYISIKIKC